MILFLLSERYLLFFQAMEIPLLIVKISFFLERMMADTKGFEILILFIPYCVMCFSFQLGSFNSILESFTVNKRIRRSHNQLKGMKMANSFPWHNIFAITFTFTPHIWIPIIFSFWKTFSKICLWILGYYRAEMSCSA